MALRCVLFVLSMLVVKGNPQIITETWDYYGGILVTVDFYGNFATTNHGIIKEFDCAVECMKSPYCAGYIMNQICQMMSSSLHSDKFRPGYAATTFHMFHKVNFPPMCPGSGYKWSRGHSRYSLTNTTSSWLDAKSQCGKTKGELVIIQDTTEQNLVEEIRNSSGQQDAYVGALNTGDGWKWHDGNPAASESWLWGNSFSNTTGYAVISNSSYLELVNGTEQKVAICECYDYEFVSW